MMYSNKLVAVIKANGRILRENNGTVQIPFGTEYSIQLKNLHTEKAVVSIDIDGSDVCDNSRYIVYPGQSVEVEGFLKGNAVTRKFKFIEKTQQISDFRGDEIEDGLIKFTYQFEKPYVYPTWYSSSDFIIGNNLNNLNNLRGITKGSNSGDAPPVFGSTTSVNYCSTNIRATCDVHSEVAMSNAPVFNDAGITGKGSKSDQMFRNGYIGTLESEKHTMIIQLKGGVRKPIYVQTKLQCEFCGRKWPSKNEYCGSCGNALRD